MNEAPEAFDQMLDNLPVGQAPVDRLLRAGHATKRRRRRASVLGAAAVTALVLSGVAVGSNALIPDEQQQPPAAGTSTQSTPVDLPTNGSKPRLRSDVGTVARISGTLGLDENNCVVLNGDPGSGARTYVTWPAGYSATINPDGPHLFDADGTQVAQSGDQIAMGGRYSPAPTGSRPCLPQGQGQIGVVQSEVTVTSTSRPTDETTPTGPLAPGAPAVWTLAPQQRLTQSSTTLTVDVSRLDCNGGITGQVWTPTIEYSDQRVIVTFEVEGRTGNAISTCQSNRPVTYEVVLDQPLGDRTLVDGQCEAGEAAVTTSYCSPNGLRWKPGPTG